MIKHRKTISTFLIACNNYTIAACKKEQSSTTGWEYNQPKNGGFEVVPYEEQETGPWSYSY